MQNTRTRMHPALKFLSRLLLNGVAKPVVLGVAIATAPVTWLPMLSLDDDEGNGYQKLGRWLGGTSWKIPPS